MDRNVWRGRNFCLQKFLTGLAGLVYFIYFISFIFLFYFIFFWEKKIKNSYFNLKCPKKKKRIWQHVVSKISPKKSFNFEITIIKFIVQDKSAQYETHCYLSDFSNTDISDFIKVCEAFIVIALLTCMVAVLLWLIWMIGLFPAKNNSFKTLAMILLAITGQLTCTSI